MPGKRLARKRPLLWVVDSGELDPGVPGDVDPPLGSVKNSLAKSGCQVSKVFIFSDFVSSFSSQ
jgi:hypothetical protein